MIVVANDSELRVVTQVDHAHFAAELASLWRTDGVPEHPRRDDLLFAIREHDNGWQETDSAPSIDRQSGRPHDFLTLPDAERIEVWRRGTRRFRDQRPWAALLIGRHARAVHRETPTSEWEALFAELAEREGEAVETGANDRHDLDRDYAWLAHLDAISLAVCNRWTTPFTAGRTRVEVAGDRLLLDPFPLAGRTRFEIRCRTIPDRRYASDTDLAVELAAARWGKSTVVVTKRNEFALNAPA